MKKFQGCSLGVGAPICKAHFEAPDETILDTTSVYDVIDHRKTDKANWKEPIQKKEQKKLTESDDTTLENRPLYSEEDENGAHSPDTLHI